MTRRRPANGPRAAVGQILALALIPGAAALLLLLAARNFAPSVTVGGLAGSAIGGWSLRGTPAAFGEIVLGFDLAAQANLTAGSQRASRMQPVDALRLTDARREKICRKRCEEVT